MKRIYKATIFGLSMIFLLSCNNFLERDSEGVIPNEDVFSDDKMTLSALSNLYGRMNWGQNIDNDKAYVYLDEACWSNGSPETFNGFSNDFLRVYDYGLIRNMNQFLEGLRSSAADHMDQAERKNLEGEVRFLRAWTYFQMCRGLGGMPIVGDEVFEYSAGTDITTLQYARSTESEMYDYIIAECEDIASNFLKDEVTVNSARANKWTALALKARAALYAGSIAKYNNLLPNPVKTDGGEVGIPASKSDEYYQIALKAAQDIIASGKYGLYDGNPDKRINFYEATSVKANNNEVIWTRDHYYPGDVTAFSYHNVPTSVAEDEESSQVTPILNLIEAYEYTNNRDGDLKTEDTDGNYIFYDKAEDLFEGKDPRLWGTVIYPGAEFKEQQIVFQAGRKYLENGIWTDEIGPSGSKDGNGEIITSINGPLKTNDNHRNKSGFCVRKFLDTKKQSSTRQGGDMWFIRFRYAEILLVASEASLELGNIPTALGYINQVRDRAGIQNLKNTLTLDEIMRERRVELAFEDHRYWDLKRWRKAHLIWTGQSDNYNAVHYALFPFKINEPGNPNNGKWVFDKIRTHMTQYPIFFEMKNYYNFIDQGWRNNNPKITLNPFQ